MAMTGTHGKRSLPTAHELRRQFDHARLELGRTVEALASKEQVEQVAGRLRETAAHAARLVEDKTPDRVRGRAVRAATRVRDTASRAGRLTVDKNLDSMRGTAVRAATTARANRTVLIGAGGVLTAVLLVRRTRRARRARLAMRRP